MTTDKTEDVAPASDDTGRIEAFSDGVFAIAITLLVLDLKIPHETADGELIPALLKLWPSYLAFLTSFLTIGVMWINHHRLFSLIVRSDQLLLVFNSLLLLGVTILPFPTALVAEFLGRRDAVTAAIVYNGTFVMIAIFFGLLWRYASHNNRLLDPRSDPKVITGITRQYAFGPLMYIGVLLLALVSVPASLGVNILLAVYFALPGHLLRREGGGDQSGGHNPPIRNKTFSE
ncbi:MAG: TMEM175 family protein [Candidatus Kapaibacterium sp.]